MKELLGARIIRSGREALKIAKMHIALRRIAKGDYSDLAGDTSQWASEIAYDALGGRHKNGRRVDNPDDL